MGAGGRPRAGAHLESRQFEGLTRAAHIPFSPQNVKNEVMKT